jgi:hypothetical protein
MTTTNKFLLLLTDGKLMRLVQSSIGPEQWRRMLLGRKAMLSPSGERLVVYSYTAGDDVTAQSWRDWLRQYKDPVSGWIIDTPELRDRIDNDGPPFPDRPKAKEPEVQTAEPKAVTGPEAVAELERSVRSLTRTVSAPRRRIPVRDANGDIVVVHEVVDAPAVTEQQVAELNAAVQNLARATDAPRRRIPIRDAEGNIVVVHDIPGETTQ